ncbi:unnamed protein product [Mucor fragilis]
MVQIVMFSGANSKTPIQMASLLSFLPFFFLPSFNFSMDPLQYCPHCSSRCQRETRCFKCYRCHQRYHRSCYDSWFGDIDPNRFCCYRCRMVHLTNLMQQLEVNVPQSPPLRTPTPPPPPSPAAASPAAVSPAPAAEATPTTPPRLSPHHYSPEKF